MSPPIQGIAVTAISPCMILCYGWDEKIGLVILPWFNQFVPDYWASFFMQEIYLTFCGSLTPDSHSTICCDDRSWLSLDGGFLKGPYKEVYKGDVRHKWFYSQCETQTWITDGYMGAYDNPSLSWPIEVLFSWYRHCFLYLDSHSLHLYQWDNGPVLSSTHHMLGSPNWKLFQSQYNSLQRLQLPHLKLEAPGCHSLLTIHEASLSNSHSKWTSIFHWWWGDPLGIRLETSQYIHILSPWSWRIACP